MYITQHSIKTNSANLKMSTYYFKRCVGVIRSYMFLERGFGKAHSCAIRTSVRLRLLHTSQCFPSIVQIWNVHITMTFNVHWTKTCKKTKSLFSMATISKKKHQKPLHSINKNCFIALKHTKCFAPACCHKNQWLWSVL